MIRIPALVLVGLTARASAQPPPAQPPGDVSLAPRPGHESGRLDPEDTGESTGRSIARGALYVPKLAFEVVSWPFASAIYVDERYAVEDWYHYLFYWRDRTIRLVPTATWSTGYGGTVGLRFEHRDLFGENERALLQASVGTTYRVDVRGAIDSGTRWQFARLEALGNWDRRPQEPFYGFGNDAPDDKRTFRYEEARGAIGAAIPILATFYGEVLGSIARIHYSEATRGDPLDLNTLMALGENTTTNHGYLQGQLVWDTRRPASVWDAHSMTGVGTLGRVFGGRSFEFNSNMNNIDFWHYGGEVQQYLRFGPGPQLVMGRFHAEAVTGPVNEVPLTELPMLGGGVYLRGYPYGRFRDRVAMVGSVQYMWELLQYAAAYTFVDVGRVYRGWNDVTWDGMRVGFGVGIHLHKPNSFLADLAIASSKDGGVQVMAEFSPVLDARERWR